MLDRLVEETTMIPFLEKTWFLWWMLADVVVLCWFHALSTRNKNQVEGLDMLDSEEEEAYIVSWQLLRRARAISFSWLGTER